MSRAAKIAGTVGLLIASLGFLVPLGLLFSYSWDQHHDLKMQVCQHEAEMHHQPWDAEAVRQCEVEIAAERHENFLSEWAQLSLQNLIDLSPIGMVPFGYYMWRQQRQQDKKIDRILALEEARHAGEAVQVDQEPQDVPSAQAQGVLQEQGGGDLERP